MSRVRDNLYLASVSEALTMDKTITHVLSLMEDGAPDFSKTCVNHKVVAVEDSVSDNLLDELDECVEFIQQGLAETGTNKVLVHCRQGVSRSASIVVAFLMKTENLSLEAALEQVRDKRPKVNPNSNFIRQLDAYQTMGCRVDKSDAVYKNLARFLAQTPPPDCGTFDRVQVEGGVVLSCSGCGRALAGEGNLVRHAPLEPQCEAVFLQPMKWMSNVVRQQTKGQLTCPCGAIVGTFNWLWCASCSSCGKRITPAFQITENSHSTL